MEFIDELTVADSETTLADESIEGSPAAPARAYPSIFQSFGILLIYFICAVSAAPVLMVFGGLSVEVSMLYYYVASMGLTFAVIHTIRRSKLGSSNYCFRIDSWKLVVPLVLTSAALLFGVIGPLVSLIPMPDAAGEGFSAMMGQIGPATFLYFVIAAPVLEELIFRGIMLDGLLQRYRPVTAVLVSSIIFGLAHLNPWQFVTAFVLGCYMGWVYLNTRSVGPCILIHMTANLCGYLVRVAYTSMGTTDNAQPTEGGWIAYVVFPAICLMVIFVSVLYLRQEFHRIAMKPAEDEPGLA